MSEKKKANLIKYGITLGLGLVMAYVYVSLRDFSAQTLVEKYRILCDAFTTPAVLFIMSGALVSVSNAGALDGLIYVVTQGLGMLIPGKGLGTESYRDYVERVSENRVKGYSFLYISGLILLVVALIFMALFYINR